MAIYYYSKWSFKIEINYQLISLCNWNNITLKWNFSRRWAQGNINFVIPTEKNYIGCKVNRNWTMTLLPFKLWPFVLLGTETFNWIFRLNEMSFRTKKNKHACYLKSRVYLNKINLIIRGNYFSCQNLKDN